MNNNDILRQIRYTFDFNDTKMIELFSLAELEVNRSQVSNWLKKEDDPAFQEITDHQMAIFLNGLINDKRGKFEGEQAEAEKRLNNNIIFRKLKIALELRDDDIIEMFRSVDMNISKPELSSFFRNSKHRQYRECKDQFLRNFLFGMQKKYRETI